MTQAIKPKTPVSSRPSAPTRTEPARDKAVDGIRMSDLPNLNAQRPTRVAEPEPATPVTVQRTLADELKDAATNGLAGRVVVDANGLNRLGSQLSMISGTGPYLPPGHLATGVVISVDATAQELHVDVSRPNSTWQRGSQRFVPTDSDRAASGALSISNPACLKYLETHLDLQVPGLPTIVVLMPPVVRDLDDETREKLVNLAAERKVAVAVVELQEGSPPVWHPDL